MYNEQTGRIYSLICPGNGPVLFSLVGPGRTRSDQSFRLWPAKKYDQIWSDRVWAMKKNGPNIARLKYSVGPLFVGNVFNYLARISAPKFPKIT